MGYTHMGVCMLPTVKKREGREVPLRLDDRGRLTLPADVREALHWEPGDIVYLRQEDNGLHILKGANPFDALAEEALHEYEAGETQDIRDIAKEWDNQLDATGEERLGRSSK